MGSRFEPRRDRGGRRHVGPRGWALTAAEDGVIARTRPPLVGRIDELEAVSSLLDDVRVGRPAALRVTGMAGVGRSRLLEATADLAARRDLHAVIVRCRPSSTEFAPLRSLVGDALDPSTPAPTMQAQAVAVSERILESAAQGSLILCIDDMEQADAATTMVADHLARATTTIDLDGPPRRFAIVAATGDDVDAVDTGWRTLPLGPLSRNETIDLFKHFALGSTSRWLAEAVADRSEGNPQLVRLIADLLLSQHRIGPSAADAHLPAAEPAGWALPPTAHRAVDELFGRLSSPTRRVLAIAALPGTSPDQAWLRDLGQHDEPAIEEALAEAAEAGLIDGGTPIGFSHPFYRERALSELSLTELEQLHRRAATLVRAQEVGASRELVEHLRRAGSQAEPAEVFEAALEAGRSAAGRREWVSAAQSLQLAATVGRRLATLDTTGLSELCRELVDALLAAGEASEARRWAKHAATLAAEAGDRPGWARSTVAAAKAGVWTGSFGDQLDASQLTEIAEDGAFDLLLRAESALVASEVAWMSGDSSAASDWAAKAIVRGAAARAGDVCARASVSAATSRWLVLDLRGSLEHLDEALAWASGERTGGAPDPASLALVQGRRALNLMWMGRLEESETAVAAALDAADEANTPLERALPLVARATIAGLRADHSRVVRDIGESGLLSSIADDRWAASFGLSLLAADATWRGRMAEAGQQLDRWTAMLPRTEGNRPALAKLAIDMCRHHLRAIGGDRTAGTWLREMAPPPDGQPIAPSLGSSSFFALLLDSADRLGETSVAATVRPYLADALDRGELLTAGWPQLTARLLAVAARDMGQLDDALEHATHALELADACGLVVESCLAHAELARIAARLGHAEEMTRHREAAAGLALEHGLEWLIRTPD